MIATGGQITVASSSGLKVMHGGFLWFIESNGKPEQLIIEKKATMAAERYMF
jgi:hypothetical protein